MKDDSRAFIYWGADDYTMWETITKTRETISTETGSEVKVEQISGDETTAQKLIDAISAGDFFSSQRFVIINGFLNYLEKTQEKAANRKKKPAQMESFSSLVEYFKQGPPPGVSVFFLEITSKKPKSPFFTALSSVIKTRDFPALRGDDLRKWIIGKVKDSGCKISGPAASALMNLVGGNLFALSSEIEKLVLISGGKTIEEEDIKRVTSYAREPTIFNLVDSIIEKNKPNSQNYLHQLLAEGEEPIHIVALLERQLSFLVRTRDLMDKKTPLVDIQKKIGLSGFQWDKVVTQTRGCTMPRLVKFYDTLLSYDLSMKKGLLPKELALELLVTELWFV